MDAHKLVLLGETAVGKSSIVMRFMKDDFRETIESTIGAAYSTRSVPLNTGGEVRFEIWDTAGQERYHSLAPMYYRGAAAAIVVFDIRRAHTFEKAQRWVTQLQQSGHEGMVVALAGNKCDCDPGSRQVDARDARHYADKHKLLFLETSAKEAINVNELFEQIAEELGRRQKARRAAMGGAGGAGLIVTPETGRRGGRGGNNDSSPCSCG